MLPTTHFRSRFAASQLIISRLWASVVASSPSSDSDNSNDMGAVHNGDPELRSSIDGVRYTERVPAATRLRHMLSDPRKAVFAPGVYDGLSARVALAQGYDCLYMLGCSMCVACRI